MPQPPTTAAATVAAAASSTPGGGHPVLGAWLVVRRRFFLSFPKRRYVTLTDDHVLIVDSTPVLHLVDCIVNTHASSKTIDLLPAAASGVSVRILADSPFQYSKWRMALQSAAAASLHRCYRVDPTALLGVGVHGIVRRAYPHHLPRDHSLESTTTASEFSVLPPELLSLSRSLFKRRSAPPPATRNSVDIDPDALSDPHDILTEGAVPSSKNDKRLLRQQSPSASAASAASAAASAAAAAAAIPVSPTAPPFDDYGPIEPPLPSMAVKTISRTTNGPPTVASEVLFARARLNHYAIIRVLHLFEAVTEAHVVMEECLGPLLTDYVHANGPFADVDANAIFLPLVKAVGYMHACGIVHWDICPNNVMFVSPTHPFEPKIIDFGTARPIDPANGRVPLECGIFQEKGKVASLACASPELLTSKAHRYAAKADMWQLGCVLYFLLVGKLPFSKRNVQDLSVSSTILAYCKKRSAERREFLFGTSVMGTKEVGEPAKELILKLLCPNPRMRPNAMQCLREFSYLNKPTI